MKKMTDTEKENYDVLVAGAEQISHDLQLEGIIYGYARISRRSQNIERQIRNLIAFCPEIKIYKEAYTGRKMSRPEWFNLLKRVKAGDTIVFDSVSRMSRTADEGVETYFELYEKGVKLVFLKERHIDTDVYTSAVEQSIPATGNDIADIYIEATNKVIRLLAEKQIRKAFEQAEKEVEDLHQRTKEGIETARMNGKQIGILTGQKLEIKKKKPAMELIRKHCIDFGGGLTDKECMKLCGISRNTYYKYKKEITEG